MFVLALAAEGGVQILPDLSMIVHMVIILVMIWILNRTFFRPINKVIAARSTGQGGQFAETKGMLKSAEEKEQEYKDELLSAREEGYILIEKEKAAAVATRQETIAKAKAVIESKREADFEELSALTAIARESIDSEAGKMADEITSSVLKVA